MLTVTISVKRDLCLCRSFPLCVFLCLLSAIPSENETNGEEEGRVSLTYGNCSQLLQDAMEPETSQCTQAGVS